MKRKTTRRKVKNERKRNKEWDTENDKKERKKRSKKKGKEKKRKRKGRSKTARVPGRYFSPPDATTKPMASSHHFTPPRQVSARLAPLV